MKNLYNKWTNQNKWAKTGIMIVLGVVLQNASDYIHGTIGGILFIVSTLLIIGGIAEMTKKSKPKVVENSSNTNNPVSQ